eukprot:COSAG01_NODE_3233_length_6376_cov_6.983750_3_plen_96_part_00
MLQGAAIKALVKSSGAQVNLSPVGGGGADSSRAGAPGERRRGRPPPPPPPQQDQIASVSGGAEAVAQAVEHIQAVRACAGRLAGRAHGPWGHIII